MHDVFGFSNEAVLCVVGVDSKEQQIMRTGTQCTLSIVHPLNLTSLDVQIQPVPAAAKQ